MILLPILMLGTFVDDARHWKLIKTNLRLPCWRPDVLAPLACSPPGLSNSPGWIALWCCWHCPYLFCFISLFVLCLFFWFVLFLCLFCFFIHLILCVFVCLLLFVLSQCLCMCAWIHACLRVLVHACLRSCVQHVRTCVHSCSLAGCHACNEQMCMRRVVCVPLIHDTFIGLRRQTSCVCLQA